MVGIVDRRDAEVSLGIDREDVPTAGWFCLNDRKIINTPRFITGALIQIG